MYKKRGDNRDPVDTDEFVAVLYSMFMPAKLQDGVFVKGALPSHPNPVPVPMSLVWLAVTDIKVSVYSMGLCGEEGHVMNENMIDYFLYDYLASGNMGGLRYCTTTLSCAYMLYDTHQIVPNSSLSKSQHASSCCECDFILQLHSWLWVAAGLDQKAVGTSLLSHVTPTMVALL